MESPDRQPVCRSAMISSATKKVLSQGEQLVMTDREKARILIVDDEPHICEILCRWLKLEGYSCAMAFCGEEALKALKENPVDLVLSDILMPGMSGMDLLQIMEPLFPDVAVLMVTAVDDLSTGVLAVELGAYGYVTKPFNKNEILISVAAALQRRCEKLRKSEGQSTLDSTECSKSHKRGTLGVSTVQAAKCFRSGMDAAQLMEEFDLSAKGLHSLMERLVTSGKLTQSEVDERKALSPESVIVEMGQEESPGSGMRKPVIDAADAVSCIRAGMDDLALMRRYNISPKGLQSLFKKLVTERIIDRSELEDRMTQPCEAVILDE